MAERRVWIAQCLCPARHCILAGAETAESRAGAEREILAPLREQVADWLRREIINPWCGLCGAKVETWRYEIGRTRFGSMAEAMPSMREGEAQQAAARAVFGDLHKTRPN
jgi:hypothetical protein